MSPVVEGDSSRVHETKKSASFIELLASSIGLSEDEYDGTSPVKEDLAEVQLAKSSVSSKDGSEGKRLPRPKKRPPIQRLKKPIMKPSRNRLT